LRVLVVIYFAIAICILILARVFSLSIGSNEYYERLSNKNYLKREYTPPPRGAILDRNGEYLAINNIGFRITVKPHLRDPNTIEDLHNIFKMIEKYFPKYTYKDLEKKYEKEDGIYNHEDIVLVEHIPYDDFFKYYPIFNSNDYIDIKSSTSRFYPYGVVGAHFLGYTGRVSVPDIDKDENQKHFETIGRSGIEKFYNSKLQGTLGVKTIKVNSVYKIVGIAGDTPPIAHDIHTTVDIRLQQYIHERFGDQAGAVIVMDVHNGEILAGGSFPEFDNNIFVNGVSHDDWETIINDFNHPFTNKLINGKYPPGSVIKMGVAMSLLENGISPDTKVYCTGSMPLGNRNFRCWKTDGHGETGFVKAIRESCDDFFYKGSLKIGVDAMHDTLAKFGMGEQTGVDQPNESKGINPNKFWKEKTYKAPWYQGETVVSAIGQGFLTVTPMQIVRYTGTLATGKLVTPHFLKDTKAVQIKDVNIPLSYLALARQGMYEVANSGGGTAVNNVRNSLLKIAAKTGTAQVIGIPQSEKKRMQEHEMEYYQRSHAWLTSFAPYDKPKYAVTVLVEHGGHGGSAAGEITGDIYNKLIELGYIDNNTTK
jgi:penicillin-binding protein 2